MTEAEFEGFLNTISSCFLSKDLAPLLDCVLLPMTLVTKEGPITIATVEDCEAYFERSLKAQEIMRIDEIYRRAISLEDCKDGTFIGTYETQLLSHGQRVADPYTSSALIHATNDGWKFSSILNARGYLSAVSSGPETKGRT